MKSKPDFVIVGSGGGGGTIAWVLAKAGFKVVVLEQGSNFAEQHRDATIPFDPSVHNEMYYRLKKPDPKRRLRGDYNTFVDREKGSTPVPFGGGWTGSVLGGGSVLWGTWSFRPLPIDFQLKTLFERTGQFGTKDSDLKDYSIVNWPIKYSEMAPFFSVAEALLGVSGDRPSLNASIKESPWYKAMSSQFGGERWFGTEDEWFPAHDFPLGAYPTTPVGQLVADGMRLKDMHPFPTPVAIVQPGSGGFKTRDAIALARIFHQEKESAQY